MSDTPETDAAIVAAGGEWSYYLGKCSRKLERERDEAGKELSSIHRWIERNHPDGFIDSLTYLQNLERVTDSWYDRIDAIETDARRFVKERDEAMAELEEYRSIAENIGAEKAVSEKEKAIRERDEALEALKALAPLTYHDCYFYKDMMGDCMLCKKETTK